MNPLVDIAGLCLDYRHRGQLRRALDHVDLQIGAGEMYGLVGPSASGKSSVAHALTRFLPPGARLHARRLAVAGSPLLPMKAQALRLYRRREVGMVYQEPARALNPTSTAGAQIAEAHRLSGLDRQSSRRAAVASLEAVGFAGAGAGAGADAAGVARRYPHELSGGQQQRVMIAMALASQPSLLILDEPTTALDGTAQAEILDLIARLQSGLGFACLLISHDLALVEARCDRVGRIEAGVLGEAIAPRAVQHTVPAPASETVPVPARVPAPRHSVPARRPIPRGEPIVLRASDIHKNYGSQIAIEGVDVRLARGETLAVIGESGSGKSTLGRVIAGLVGYQGRVEVAAATTPHPVQLVFQSAEASLNPRRTVRQTLSRATALLHGDSTAAELLARVALDADVLDRLPHQLSGGQKQRVAVARAMAGPAAVVVFDETTSSLDGENREVVLDLLIETQESTGVSFLFISHDLWAVQRIAHRVAVLHRGRVVETASTAELFTRPAHAVTRALVAGARTKGLR